MTKRSLILVTAAAAFASPLAAGQSKAEPGQIASAAFPLGEIEPVVGAPPRADQVSNVPRGVRAMIDAAMATGDKGKIETVLSLASQTTPNGAPEIKAIETAWRADVAEKARLAREANTRRIREASVLELWTGEGQLGGFHSTGNSSNVGLSAGLNLKRQGEDWSHALRATADYQRSNGVTSREQFLFAYEPRYQIKDELFAYGLAQYERNPILGFSSRYALSGGVGYQIASSGPIKLAIKAGPALRMTDFDLAENETRLAALFGFDFDWQIAERLALTQDANMVAETGGAATVIVDSTRTTLNLVTGLDAKVSDRLRSRVTYTVDYDSKPPIGRDSTDAVTRVTLVYGF
ncbi:YdiY family protein [Pelagerythrobacter sp.]|uniref:DUF481 domain-containing protein n=1 Tax=Pelagerythrobacter sp. TaxID=2800702 RepID=UPI0035AF2E7D